jgi:lysyl-tRNA synthetase class 1
MFWADEVAQKLKTRGLPLEWVDDMKTPSGKIHVGALRGVVIHDLVFKALKGLKVNAKYTYIFDDHDPMDSLPTYLDKKTYEQYLGVPLYKIPSPVKGFENYAKCYAKDFTDVFNKIGCNPQIIWATELYLTEKMNPVIKEVLDNADKIRKIYERLYKKEISKNWYPFQVYCPRCGKVSTTRVFDWDGKEISFVCEVDKLKWTKGCGFKSKTSPFSSKNGISGKLSWKVEWPAKWKTLGITVEGAGKDHMSSGGSHDLAKLVCEEVLSYRVPYPLPYEFFLLGGKKMSSSKGIGASASDMLDILPPGLLRFLMVKTKPNQAINFDPAGDTIPNLFDDYQKAAEAYFSKKDDDNARIFESSQIKEIQKPPSIRFSVLAQWVQMPNMEEEIKKEGLDDWVKFAKVWVEKFAPEKDKFTVLKTIPTNAKNLSDEQKKYLQKISEELNKTWEAEEFQKQLYEWAKELEVNSKDAFSAIYLSLIGKDHGPKAGWLILSLDKDFIKKRFSEVV